MADTIDTETTSGRNKPKRTMYGGDRGDAKADTGNRLKDNKDRGKI